MSRAVTLAGYAALVAVLVALEVAGRRSPTGVTAGRVLAWLLRHPALHLVLTAGWLWLGWHLFVRASRG